MSETEQELVDCPTCNAETRADFDFCLECGHSLGWTGGTDSSDEMGLDPSEDDVIPCPSCRTSVMRSSGHGHPQCEGCGYMERH